MNEVLLWMQAEMPTVKASPEQSSKIGGESSPSLMSQQSFSLSSFSDPECPLAPQSVLLFIPPGLPSLPCPALDNGVFLYPLGSSQGSARLV